MATSTAVWSLVCLPPTTLVLVGPLAFHRPLIPPPILSLDRKSTRLNSSHTEIYTLSLHDALPIYKRNEHTGERTSYPTPPTLHHATRSPRTLLGPWQLPQPCGHSYVYRQPPSCSWDHSLFTDPLSLLQFYH